MDRLSKINDIEIYRFTKECSLSVLNDYLKEIDGIYHLAGVNRPQNEEGMVVIRKRRMYMKVLKCGVMLLSILFVSQLHVYAEENRWTWPVEGQISDYFGTRHGKHYGIDVAAPIGTPVAAIQDGKVTRSYYS
ncbi:hypothetical protein ACT4UM_12815, partial [Bacillus sp. SS-TM]